MAVSIGIQIVQNSQSIVNNTSNVTVKVYAKWTFGSHNALVDANGTPQAKGSIDINGTTYDFASTFNTGKTSSGSQTIFIKTVTIPHNSDGTKKLSCSARYVTGVSSGTVRATASKTLTTIARKSTMSVANGTLGTAQTLTVTRQATSFTHSIKAVCGSSTLYIKADGTTQSAESKHSDCSISFKPPISWASQNTTGTTVSVTYTLTTYNGSTNVGSNSYSTTYTIPTSVKPSCSVTVEDATDIYDTYGSFIQGLSKFKVTVTPTLSYGSAIKTYKSIVNGLTYTSASFTTDALSSSGTVKVSATVTDKRGRSGSAEVSKTVTPYSPPSVKKLTVKRCNADGSDNDGGNCVLVRFAGSVTTLSDRNTAAYTLQYKATTEDQYTEVKFDGSTSSYTVPGLSDSEYTYDLPDYTDVYSVEDGQYIFEADTSKSYDVMLVISDTHKSTPRSTVASTGYTLMHFGLTGDAIGIGKVAELSGVLDIGLQTRLTGGLLYPELEAETDLNDVRTPGFYSGENISTYNYVNLPPFVTSGTFTLDVSSGGAAGQVKQRFVVCHKTDSRTFERFYYGESWGDWICVSDFANKQLWEGVYYMNANQTITLSEPVSKQPTGIVLLFLEFDATAGTAISQSIHTRFIPKSAISRYSGCGHCIQLTSSLLGYFATKYLYITDTQITGHDNNSKTGTGACGITYTNNRFVLRRVYGV